MLSTETKVTQILLAFITRKRPMGIKISNGSRTTQILATKDTITDKVSSLKRQTYPKYILTSYNAITKRQPNLEITKTPKIHK